MPHPSCFTSRKNLVPIVEEAWWTPRPILMGVENLAPTTNSSLDRPAHKHFKDLVSGGSHQFLTALSAF